MIDFFDETTIIEIAVACSLCGYLWTKISTTSPRTDAIMRLAVIAASALAVYFGHDEFIRFLVIASSILLITFLLPVLYTAITGKPTSLEYITRVRVRLQDGQTG